MDVFFCFSAHLELGTSHLELGTIHPGDTCQGTSHLKLGTSHLEPAPIKNLARGDKPSARGQTTSAHVHVMPQPVDMINCFALITATPVGTSELSLFFFTHHTV